MHRILNILYQLVLTLILFYGKCAGQSPLMKDPATVQEIRQTLHLIYNFEFGQANQQINRIERNLGDHPACFLLRAMIIYWRDRPLGPGTEPYNTYEKDLNKAIDLSESFLDRDELHAEGVFYSMDGYALLAELYSTQGAGLKVLGVARNAYKYLKEGMDLIDIFPDFYFSTGLYNYYREKYPELYPFYKSFLWLFTSGDKDLGIRQIKDAAEKSVFSETESQLYLFHIYLRYENNPEKAFPYAKGLMETYPGNVRFRSLYAENLIALGKFDEAVEYADVLASEDKPFHKLGGTLYKAMILEHSRQFGKALNLLDSADSIAGKMEQEDMHFETMILATRGRIADKLGNREQARKYYKAALKMDPYIPVRQEAQEYLNSHDG